MNAIVPIKSLDDIRQVLDGLPRYSDGALAQAEAREPQLTKPQGALGRLEDLSHWVAKWQGSYPPRIKSVHCNVYAGNHGIVAQGVSAYPQEVTAQMVQNFIDGGAAVNQICTIQEVDLQVHEMALNQPSEDFSQKPAMDEEDACEAFFYGMTTVKDHTDLLCVGEMGIGNTTAAAALAHASLGGEARDWVGRGTGIDDARLARKIELVQSSVALHKASFKDGLDAMMYLGGRELCALAGSVIAARLKNIPVLLDGYVSTAAMAPLFAYQKTALDHCRISHLSAETGHEKLSAALGQTPIMDLNMALGEASGAVLAVGLVRSAVACHNNMATFSSAGVAPKSP